ncbi:MAG: hypothetical protein IIV61_07100 [Oscillospiraceae bacterium]|nr:hypothetical protein [Oscillospiraceae bacterium]
MEKFVFDDGVREFQVNGGGVLRFNPGDMNLYGRFLEAAEKIRTVETELVAAGQQALDGAGVLRLMVEADRKLKDILGWVFGEGNDLDAVLGGVNLLAVAGNGERVIVNLMTAVRPVLEAGAKACVRAQVDRAVEDAEAERARRKLTMDN